MLWPGFSLDLFFFQFDIIYASTRAKRFKAGTARLIEAMTTIGIVYGEQWATLATHVFVTYGDQPEKARDELSQLWTKGNLY